MRTLKAIEEANEKNTVMDKVIIYLKKDSNLNDTEESKTYYGNLQVFITETLNQENTVLNTEDKRKIKDHATALIRVIYYDEKLSAKEKANCLFKICMAKAPNVLIESTASKKIIKVITSIKRKKTKDKDPEIIANIINQIYNCLCQKQDLLEFEKADAKEMHTLIHKLLDTICSSQFLITDALDTENNKEHAPRQRKVHALNSNNETEKEMIYRMLLIIKQSMDEYWD